METKNVRNSSYYKQKKSRFLGGSGKQYCKSQSVTVRIGDGKYLLFLEFCTYAVGGHFQTILGEKEVQKNPDICDLRLN